MLKKYVRLPLYPIFAAMYPVLALLSYNLGQVQYTAGLRPLILMVLAGMTLFLMMRLIYRHWHRAAFVSAALVLIFFIYGPVYDLISAKWKISNLNIWMLSLCSVLAAIVLVAGAFRRLRFESAALVLNIILLGLLIYPSYEIIRKSYRSPREPYFKSQDLKLANGQVPPDIYYIMPEDYGRVDLLKTKFDIDVSDFMQHLKDMGFYIAECSQSNYSSSELSLGSSLNMAYLQDLDDSFDPESTNQRPIWDSIRYSAVAADLKKAGYKTVAFATGFGWSELDNSDIYISPSPLTSGMTNFESLLLRTTPIRHLQDVGLINLDEIDGEQYRERTMLEFDSFSELAHIPGPKFVFVHIINPHEPFVFGPDGSPIDPAPFINKDHLYTQKQYTLGFQYQIPFLNMMLEKSIQTLITESAVPPVILLQTDTGPLFMTGNNKFVILNAYYMPGHTDGLYPGISPVNTFRTVFNAYFGTDYPMLDDVSYTSPIPHIYDFTKSEYAPCASGWSR